MVYLVDETRTKSQSRSNKRLFEGGADVKFVVAPHFRLQEWVAEERGFREAAM